MTTSSPTAAQSEKLFVFPWMASRNFDLAWYFLPILVALTATVLIQQFPAMGTGLLFLLLTNAFGVGPAHQGPTWFFYFDKKNREHWTADKKRLFFYFFVPVFVFVGTVVLQVMSPGIGFAITTMWGVQHFVQQNLGMTMLYHNKNGNEAIPERSLLSRSLWTPSIFFVTMFFIKVLSNPVAGASVTGGRLPPLPEPKPMEAWAIGLLSVLGAIALFDVARYLLEMRRQVAQGARINVPAFMFWAVSVLYFAPFIFPGQRLETMFLIPGTMHWFQYIGLNLILVKEKYNDEERKSDIPCGALPLMATLCIGSALFFVLSRGYQQTFDLMSPPFLALLGVYFGLSNVHYYQDAFFWRFREKFQRESIMPYLLRARNTVS
jgi:hypothetical protein